MLSTPVILTALLAALIAYAGQRGLRRRAARLEQALREEAAWADSMREHNTRLREAQEIADLRLIDWPLSGSPDHWVRESFRLLALAYSDEADRYVSLRQIHADDKDKVKHALLDAFDSNSPIEITFRSLRADGSVRYLQARAAIRWDAPNGQPRILGTVLDVTRLSEAVEAAHRRANTDGLTGALNRNGFWERARREFDRWQRYGQPTALMMVDLDGFKQLNDRHGHSFGDEVLRSVVGCIEHQLRSSDVFARYGGDEFALVIPNSDLPSALDLGERLRDALTRLSLSVDGAERSGLVAASVGVATLQPGNQDIEQALNRADKALYQAKGAGRNRVASLG